MQKQQVGFTLIEVMIVVAIIGILAGIAYPSYLEQVRKSSRSDAIVLINDVAQRMQRCFTAQNTYKPAETGICDVVDKAKSSAAGITSKEGFYVVKLSGEEAEYTDSTYLLKVTPVTGKRQAQDKTCATFTLNQAGVRKAYNSGNTETTDDCW
jgi:type IV pilus assembly protein PilE